MQLKKILDHLEKCIKIVILTLITIREILPRLLYIIKDKKITHYLLNKNIL